MDRWMNEFPLWETTHREQSAFNKAGVEKFSLDNRMVLRSSYGKKIAGKVGWCHCTRTFDSTSNGRQLKVCEPGWWEPVLTRMALVILNKKMGAGIEAEWVRGWEWTFVAFERSSILTLIHVGDISPRWPSCYSAAMGTKKFPNSWGWGNQLDTTLRILTPESITQGQLEVTHGSKGGVTRPMVVGSSGGDLSTLVPKASPGRLSSAVEILLVPD